jgi:hypothetical protein
MTMNMKEILSIDLNVGYWIVSSSMTMLSLWGKRRLRLEDQEVIDAHELIVEAIGDGDLCERIKMATGKDLREQMTVEEVEELEQEVKMLKMGNMRN